MTTKELLRLWEKDGNIAALTKAAYRLFVAAPEALFDEENRDDTERVRLAVRELWSAATLDVHPRVKRAEARDYLAKLMVPPAASGRPVDGIVQQRNAFVHGLLKFKPEEETRKAFFARICAEDLPEWSRLSGWDERVFNSDTVERAYDRFTRGEGTR